MQKKFLFPLTLIVLILAADQFFKIWVKTHMYLGEEVSVCGNWFILHFTENNGIAFGYEMPGKSGKLFLTLFRVLAAGIIAYYLIKIIRDNLPMGFIISLCLIFVGAVGNIVDSIFYGLLFKYGKIFHGRVVDMLYFPVIKAHYPQWLPLWGGQELIFFRPVFNLSDTAITVGVFSILIFYSKLLKKV
jgi:signal peptidase II